jgi:predicted O-methyltransferase YrrM
VSADWTSRKSADPFPVNKGPNLIRRYGELFSEFAARTIVELGTLQGGGTALLATLAQPDLLVTVDKSDAPLEALDEIATLWGLSDVIRVRGGVDQVDDRRLREVVNEELAGRPLDLVIDDASHLLEPTRVSFDVLFPMMRPGGRSSRTGSPTMC